IVDGHLKKEQGSLDFWSLCQKNGVYFLEDECINLNGDDKVLHLKNFGTLEFDCLGLETQSVLGTRIQSQYSLESLISVAETESFLDKIANFKKEVALHCPRELRIVISGIHQASLEMAFVLQKQLSPHCQFVEIFMVDDWIGDHQKQTLQSKSTLLKENGIHLSMDDPILKLTDHQLSLSQRGDIEFDVLISMERGGLNESFEKLLAKGEQHLAVSPSLDLESYPSVFACGEHVQLQSSKRFLSEFPMEQALQLLVSRLGSQRKDLKGWEAKSKASLEELSLLQRKTRLLNPLKNDFGQSFDQWMKNKIHFFDRAGKFPASPKILQDCISQQKREADNRIRPWKGLSSRSEDWGLQSMSGYDWWGSVTHSTRTITEMALLKAMTQGLNPSHLRFHLTLPRHSGEMRGFLFESTLRMLEKMCEKHHLSIEGGDTFDGDFWRLTVTLGGAVKRPAPEKFHPHDYLLISRPLGYGFVWARRFEKQFDSQWIYDASKTSPLCSTEQWQEFSERWNPRGVVMTQEWGFLYHCLQKLPGGHQLTLNFRNIPRWRGTDREMEIQDLHPSHEENWLRIKEAVAFDRNEVSQDNSILWDCMGQGSLVVGVSAETWEEALSHFREIGYKEAALIGCVRPKANTNKVVLSDWMPR
ncbi:MAG: hypothetical protein AAF203_03335, partial [Pseudomonadota bacterium]